MLFYARVCRSWAFDSTHWELRVVMRGVAQPFGLRPHR